MLTVADWIEEAKWIRFDLLRLLVFSSKVRPAAGRLSLSVNRSNRDCVLCCGGSGNLVDPASSHMLVSKIKPCMSQYELLHGETANGSLKQL